MKEKRILCVEVSGNCRNLREVDSLSLAHLFALNEVGNYCSANGWKKITKTQCKNCKHAKYQGITREQAIEKMAKAIYDEAIVRCNKNWCDGKCADCPKWQRLEKLAEAVLNALLEGKDDEQ